jgi:hypothetical protein
VSCLEHCRSQLEQIVLAKPAVLYTAVSYYLRQNAKKEVQELLMIIRQARFQYPFPKGSKCHVALNHGIIETETFMDVLIYQTGESEQKV